MQPAMLITLSDGSEESRYLAADLTIEETSETYSFIRDYGLGMGFVILTVMPATS